jgi:hypothetical protein
MNHANIYCKTLDQLPREDAVNALHQALMQFNAIERGIETVDIKPAMVEIRRLLRQAGHIGFADGPGS